MIDHMGDLVKELTGVVAEMVDKRVKTMVFEAKGYDYVTAIRLANQERDIWKAKYEQTLLVQDQLMKSNRYLQNQNDLINDKLEQIKHLFTPEPKEDVED